MKDRLFKMISGVLFFLLLCSNAWADIQVFELDDRQLSALYRSARIFLFPSLYEGFGIPPLEAMASGTPIIASNRASIPEVCGEAALLVDPEKPYEIAEVTEQLLSDHIQSSAIKRFGEGQVFQ